MNKLIHTTVVGGVALLLALGSATLAHADDLTPAPAAETQEVATSLDISTPAEPQTEAPLVTTAFYAHERACILPAFEAAMERD